MTPETLIITTALGVAGTAGSVALGAVAWVGRRLFSKVDQVDILIRGDGNGTLGLNERIREVHVEVKAVRKDLHDHASGEPERIHAALLQFREDHCGVEGDAE